MCFWKTMSNLPLPCFWHNIATRACTQRFNDLIKVIYRSMLVINTGTFAFNKHQVMKLEEWTLFNYSAENLRVEFFIWAHARREPVINFAFRNAFKERRVTCIPLSIAHNRQWFIVSLPRAEWKRVHLLSEDLTSSNEIWKLDQHHCFILMYLYLL